MMEKETKHEPLVSRVTSLFTSGLAPDLTAMAALHAISDNGSRNEPSQDAKDNTLVAVRSPPEDFEQDEHAQEDDIAPLISLITSTHLISSPYPNLSNQLHLPSLPNPDRLFAIALSQLSATRPDYATAPYLDTFNWTLVFSTLRALCTQQWQRQTFYLVIFRSQLRVMIDRKRLGELDQKSHEEACASGGLLKYWFGSPDAERRNLATCIWSTRADAAAGGAGPWHRQARAAAREMYERITFETYQFVVEAGAESWRLEEFSG